MPLNEDIALFMAELAPGKVSVGFRVGQEDSLRVFAENLTPEAAVHLMSAITDRTVTAEELAARGWRSISLPADLQPTLREIPKGARWRRTKMPSRSSQFPPPVWKSMPGRLRILHPDGKADPRDTTIRHDWRAWAERNGYRQATSVPVADETQRIVLEVWQGAPSDPYLVYHPVIPGTGETEALYFLPDREGAEQFLKAAQQLAQAALATDAARAASREEQKTQPNAPQGKARGTR